MLKNSRTSILGDKPEFYHPKVKVKKIIKGKIKDYKKNLLDKYVLCWHPKFSDIRIMNLMNYAKTLIFTALLSHLSIYCLLMEIK